MDMQTVAKDRGRRVARRRFILHGTVGFFFFLSFFFGVGVALGVAVERAGMKFR
jgi:hypothetical protein